MKRMLSLLLLILLSVTHCPAHAETLSPYEEGERALAAGHLAQAGFLFEQAAAYEDARAMYRLGEIYGSHAYGAFDALQAIAWYQRAYEGYQYQAIYQIFSLFDEAEAAAGVAFYQDMAQWLESVSWRNDPIVYFQLGQLYFLEEYGMRDLAQAARWFEMRIQKEENPYALFYLYQIYSDPTYPNANEARAEEWLHRAAVAHHPEALALLDEPPLLPFEPEEYDELTLDEIPIQALTSELLEALETAHAAKLLDSVLPWLTQRGDLPELPRSAYLDDEGPLWITYTGSFLDLYAAIEDGELPEPPRYLAHLSPDCDPAATEYCNYMGMYFWGVETLFDPCPRCFPEGWKYNYTCTYKSWNANQLRISTNAALTPGRFDEPRAFVAYFDHETDECLSIAALYHKQAYILIYQREDFALSGVLDSCPHCYRYNETRDHWSSLEAGRWHCLWCGTITQVAAEASDDAP